MLQVTNAGIKAIDGCVRNCCREAHQNDCSCVYVSSADLHVLQEFSMVSGNTEDLKSPAKLSKLGGGRFPGQYGMYMYVEY